ncbi:hypothetical protein P12x_005063 [Tundrisphaera lichenicola]|uniref:hypothetical protein n=1 Tax=Tundrisphaera lichenicola TaxID=2029860 RepID=UPI003EB83C39
MRPQRDSRMTLPTPDFVRIFKGPDDELDRAIGRIGSLVNSWLNLQAEPGPDPIASIRAERRLHSAIKSSPFFGKILSFAGLNIWVNERTSEGLVESQESINLS